MALLKINGANIVAPSDYQIGIMDISKASRNANGYLTIERITTKRKIELNFAFLTKAQLAILLTQISPTFFDVTYPDPQTGVERTSSFYVGDRNSGMVDYQDGIPRYQDIKFNFIER